MWVKDSNECSAHCGQMGPITGDTLHAQMHTWIYVQYACKYIHRLPHINAIFHIVSVCLSLSLSDSYSHAIIRDLRQGGT